MAAQDLCTLSDVRAALEIPASDTSRDTLISTLISQASDAIIDDASREFAPATATATRRFRVDGFNLNLEPYDLRTATTVVLHPEGTSPQTLTAGTDYQLLPIGAPSGTYTSLELSAVLAAIASSTTAFNFGYALLDITGAWGFAAVPPAVSRACIVTVASWLRKDVTALLDAAEFTDQGLSPTFPTTLEIPRNAKALYDPYLRLRQFIC